MDKYREILTKPYEKSTRHPQMTLSERAAQFSPFAALSGYNGVIDRAEEEFRPEDLEYTDLESELYGNETDFPDGGPEY